MDDRAKFERTSRDDLRQHFDAWAEAAVISERSREAEEGPKPWTSSRYSVFVEVDDKHMRGLTETFDKSPGIKAGLPSRVRLVDAEWKAMAYEPEQDDDIEEIDGCKEEDVGWMYIPAYHLGPELYTSIQGSWHTFYIRPPGVLNW